MNNPSMKMALFGVAIAVTLIAAADILARPQKGNWAKETDPAARYMIDMERRWAEFGCTNEPTLHKFLADDFQGTAPSGDRYDKTKAVQTDDSERESACHLDDAKVRLFGDSVAILYGSERAMRKKDGTTAMRCLVWTDTWLKRSGKWQIVAAQDTAVPCK